MAKDLFITSYEFDGEFYVKAEDLKKTIENIENKYIEENKKLNIKVASLE